MEHLMVEEWNMYWWNSEQRLGNSGTLTQRWGNSGTCDVETVTEEQ